MYQQMQQNCAEQWGKNAASRQQGGLYRLRLR